MNSQKNALISRPDLMFLTLTGHVTLDFNACNNRVGCKLLQPNSTAKHIGVSSRSFMNTRCKYYTTKRESLAIVWAELLQRSYFEAKRFTIRTDHHFLERILIPTDSTARLARWRLRLFKFDFDIAHDEDV